MATPINGATAMNGTPNTPFILASSTTDPVANTTTINVPIISAINIL
jgi:hypothetical protein